MEDTPVNIQKKQLEIFMAKSEDERLTICFEMIDFGRTLAETRIKEENPDLWKPFLLNCIVSPILFYQI